MTRHTPDTGSWNAQQRAFYNSRDHKRMWFVDGSYFVNNALAHFLSFAQLDRTATILEIGCGAGRYTIPLVQLGYSVTAIDISERMLSKLREDADQLGLEQERLRLHCGDVDDLSALDGNQFDAIIGFNVLHHLSDLPACVENLSPHLSVSGLMAFLEPNAANPLHAVDTILDRGWKAEGNKSKSTPKNVEPVLARGRFRDIQYRRFGFFPPFIIDRVPALLRLEEWIENQKLLEPVLPYFVIKGTKVT